jgi:hypothetical protein
LFLRCQNNNNNNNNKKNLAIIIIIIGRKKKITFIAEEIEGNCWAGIPKVEKTPNHNQPVFFVCFGNKFCHLKTKNWENFGIFVACKGHLFVDVI